MDYQKFALCFVLLSFFSVYAGDPPADTEGAGFNIPGGIFQITDKDEICDLMKKVTEYLAEIVDKHYGSSLELVKIHSAIHRVVAGYIYELVAEINENKIPTNCTVTMWEKPWLNFVKFDVDCGDTEEHKYQYLSVEDRDEEDRTTIKAMQVKHHGI